MKTKSKLSIFALQQRLSRPGATSVLAVFTPGYLLYLVTLLVINMQKGWFAMQTPHGGANGWSTFNEIYTFEYYFKSYDYSLYSDNGAQALTDSTTPFLVRSEIVFLVSLVALVLALTMAHVKMNRGGDTIKRLPILSRSVKITQWLSDLVYTLFIWFAHLFVIFLFYMIYMHFAPAELAYPQNLYSLFAGERYLYMLFPVLNPISFVRMISLVTAISFLPSIISHIIDNLEDLGKGELFIPILLVGLICWAYFQSGHVWSIVACLIAVITGILIYKFYLPLPRRDDIDAEKST